MIENAEDGHMGWADQTAERLLASVSDPTTRLLEAVVELTAVEGGLVELAPVLAELACSVADAAGASVSRVDGADVVSIAGTGLLAGTQGMRNARAGSLAGLVVATAAPQVCHDTHQDTRVDRAACDRLGIRSMAIMPMRQASHTHALVMLASPEPGAITEDLVEFIGPLLRAAAVKLAQASAAESAAAQLALLQDVTVTSREVLLADDPGLYLVEEVARIANAQHVYLLLPQDPGRLVITRCAGHSLLGMVTAADSTTLSGAAYSTGRPKIAADWTAHPAARPHVVDALTSDQDGGARSAAYIPLMTADGPVGVVVALMHEPITASNIDLPGLLQLLAAEAGIAITRDVLRRKLADQARTDPLTGLANRRVWNERLDFEIARAQRNGAPLAVAVLDLDFFKRFNDSFGHPAGDELLRAVSDAWAGAVRPTDLLARLGGEEFGVILPDADIPAASAILERLGAVVPCDQTVSIGLTLHVGGEESGATMERADRALYAAKGAGRNRVVTQ